MDLITFMLGFLAGLIGGTLVVGVYAKRKIEKLKSSGIGNMMEDVGEMMEGMMDVEEDDDAGED